MSPLQYKEKAHLKIFKMNIIPFLSLAGLTVIADQAVLLAPVHRSFKPSQSISLQ